MDAIDTDTMDMDTMDTGTIDTGTMDTGTMERGTMERGTMDRGTMVASRRAGPKVNSLFAEDFGLPNEHDGASGKKLAEPTYTCAELAEARTASWRDGQEAGAAAAGASTAATTNALLATIAAALHDAESAAVRIAEHSVEAVARVLMDSLAKLFPTLCAQHGEAELCALVRTILPALAQEPALTVRVNPRHTPALMRELDRLDPELVERVRLVPVEAIAAGDVRVSWRDGTATRDTSGLWHQVQAVLGAAGVLSPDPTPSQITTSQSGTTQSGTTQSGTPQSGTQRNDANISVKEPEYAD